MYNDAHLEESNTKKTLEKFEIKKVKRKYLLTFI